MVFSFNAASIATLVLPLLAQALLDKPALRNDLDAFKPGLQSNLHAPGSSVKQWAAGTISQGCKDLANRESLNPQDFTTYEVLYGDCSVPWLLCRHKDSADSITKMIDDWGKVPVRLRQWTKDLLLRPDTGTHAYALGNQLVFYNSPHVAVYIHEGTHAADFGSAFQASGQLSSDQAWLNAYNADSAVPDNYARNNQVENLAQFPGLVIYDAIVSGGVRSVEPNVDRIGNQMSTMKSQAINGDYSGQVLATSGVTCSARYGNSAPVTASASSKFRRAFDKLWTRKSQAAQRKEFQAAGILFLDDYVDTSKPALATNCTVS